MSTKAALLIALTAPSIALAQSVHDADFILAIENDQLVTGAVDPVTEEIVYPQRVKAASFGTEGFPNFTNDPGFDSELGMLSPGLEVGFSILSALREWDDVNQNFDTVSTHTLTVRAAGQNFFTPATDTRVDGIVFGQANNDSGTSFHHHMQYLLNGAAGPAIDGVFLLELELWTDDPMVASTEPIYIVFSQGDGIAQEDAAVEWVENTLIAAPCLADLDGSGTLNFGDVTAFLTLYGQGDLAADLDNSGTLNFGDVTAFLTLYGQGCP